MAFTVDDILLEWTNAEPKKGVSLSMDAGLYEGYYTSIDAILFGHPADTLTMSMDAILVPDYNFATWNRTDIVIPSSGISSNLTNFPLFLKLSSSSGTTSADCSQIFKSMRYPGFSKNDDFTGTNGDPPDSTLWTLVDPGNYVSIQSNALQFSAPTGVNTESYIESNFPVYGDFDIQIDFTISSYDGASYSGSMLNLVGIRMVMEGGAISAAARCIYNLQDGFNLRYSQPDDPTSVSSSWNYSTESTGLTSGKLRLYTWAGYAYWQFWTGSEWGYNSGGGTYATLTSGEMGSNGFNVPNATNELGDPFYGPYTLQIYFQQTDDSTVTTTVSIDNVTWNKPGDLNIYNMVFVDSNDEFLPAEIVDVETTSGSEAIWLYTRVPLISSSSDTTIRLFTSPQNLTYNPLISHKLSTTGYLMWHDYLSVHNCQGNESDSAEGRESGYGFLYWWKPYYGRDADLGLYSTGYSTNEYAWPTLGNRRLGPFGPASLYPDTMGSEFTLEFVTEYATAPIAICNMVGIGWDDGTVQSSNDQNGFRIAGGDEEIYSWLTPNGVTGYPQYFTWSNTTGVKYHVMLVWKYDAYPVVYINGTALTPTEQNIAPSIYRPVDEWSVLRSSLSSTGGTNYPDNGTKYFAVRIHPIAEGADWHYATYNSQEDNLVSYDVHIRNIGIDAWVERDVDFADEIAAASSTSSIDFNTIDAFSTSIAAASSASDTVMLSRLILLSSSGATWGEDKHADSVFPFDWTVWRTSGDEAPEVMDGPYGSLIVPSGESLFSPVVKLSDFEVFYTDFSEYTVGVQPDDWTEQWHTTYATSTVEDTVTEGVTGGKYLHMDHSSNNRYAVSWDEVGTPTNVEVLTKLQQGTTASAGTHVAVRGSGTSSEQCYHILVQFPSDVIQLHKHVAASTVNIGDSYSITLDLATWYWVRFQVVGSTLRAKVWEDGTSEPSSWQVEETDTDISTGGWIGGSNYYGDNNYYDSFLVKVMGNDVPGTNRRIDLQHANLGAYTESYTIYVRGSTDPFDQLDTDPTWEEYTEPINRPWDYVQVKIVG